MSFKDRFETAGTAVLVACALAVTGMAAKREFSPPSPASAREPVKVDGWEAYGTSGSKVGNVSAPITIVEFSDFECPFCKRLAFVLDTLVAKRPDDVKLVFRHFPLTMIHPAAKPAAIAAICAEQQGRFRPMHDALFAAQGKIMTIPWHEFAAVAGIPDTASFFACIEGSEALGTLKADSVAASRLRVSGTPTVLVNRWRFVGAPTLAEIEAKIEEELANRRR